MSNIKKRGIAASVRYDKEEWTRLCAVIAATPKATRVRVTKKGTPPLLASLPEYGHAGPPPADGRCACGSSLNRNKETKSGFQRRAGLWQCTACAKGQCMWAGCERRSDFNRADGNGKECINHHCGFCTMCGSLADTNSDGNGGYLCTTCHKGRCIIDGCDRAGRKKTDEGWLCEDHGNVRCEVGGCGLIASNRTLEGLLACRAHVFGYCVMDGCECVAAGAHGRCHSHRENGDDWRAREEGPGFGYLLSICKWDSGQEVAVGWGGTAVHEFANRMNVHTSTLREHGLYIAAIHRIWFPDAKFVKENVDNWFQSEMPTLADELGVNVAGFNRESAVGVPYQFFIEEYEELVTDYRTYDD